MSYYRANVFTGPLELLTILSDPHNIYERYNVVSGIILISHSPFYPTPVSYTFSY